MEDDIEKAEFLYKISEVYYHIKQTFFSMNYAGQALDIYKKYELYGMRRVQCKFIIAGNLMDAQQHKSVGIPRMRLEHAERLDDQYMIAAYYNIGHCMYSLGDFCKAAEDFERAAAGFEAHSFRQVIQAVFSLTHIYFKTENTVKPPPAARGA